MIDKDLLKAIRFPLGDDPDDDDYDYDEDEVIDLRHLPVTEELAEELIREWFGKINPTGTRSAYYCQITKEYRRSTWAGACHADFTNRKKDKETWLACGTMFFDHKGNREQCQAVRDWMTKDNFPWKAVVPYLEPLYNRETKEQTGYLITKAGLDSLPFALILNFCIFLRMAVEKPKNVLAFKKLVDAGFDERDAFYIAGVVTYEESLNAFHEDPNESLSGAHYPISDQDHLWSGKNSSQLDWDVWFGKKPLNQISLSGENINFIWLKTREPGYKCLKFDYPDYTEMLTLNELKKQFKEWKKNVK